MRYRFIREHGDRYGVRRLCRLLDVSSSGYYTWRDRPPSRRARQDAVLLTHIRELFRAGRGVYGYRRVHARLQSELPCGRDRVARLMRQAGLRGKARRPFKVTTDSDHPFPVAPNLLAQDFSAAAVNQTWLADITYIPTDEGWLYLATIEDLFSRFIAGWAMASYLTDRLTRNSLQMALSRRQPPAGLVHHSDRGSQYASHAYRDLLAEAKIIQSMSSTGNAYDNAPMESFFSRLKNELVHHRRYRTRQEARQDIFEYIEVFYNRQRAHSALGYRSPLEFEAFHAAP